MLAIAVLTWLSLKTLHEQTIIPASLPINRALIMATTVGAIARPSLTGWDRRFDFLGQG